MLFPPRPTPHTGPLLTPLLALAELTHLKKEGPVCSARGTGAQRRTWIGGEARGAGHPGQLPLRRAAPGLPAFCENAVIAPHPEQRELDGQDQAGPGAGQVPAGEPSLRTSCPRRGLALPPGLAGDVTPVGGLDWQWCFPSGDLPTLTSSPVPTQRLPLLSTLFNLKNVSVQTTNSSVGYWGFPG